MSQEVVTLTKPPGNYTVIQVDNDISFVVNSGDVKYEAALPTSKSIGLSRKTYSKKHPVSYNPCVSFSDESISVISGTQRGKKSLPFKNSPKSISNSTQVTRKGIGRKRMAEFSTSDCPVPRKGRKKDASSSKVPPTKINGRITHRFKNKSPKALQAFREFSPDSDIEIVDIVQPGTSKSISDSFMRNLNDSQSRMSDISRKKNSTKPLASILKHSPSYPSNYDVPITEADTAPIMPSYSGIPDLSAGKSTHDMPSSMKWLSANGTIEHPPMQNGGPCSAKESARKYADKFSLYIPEMKISENESEPERIPKTKRELKKLYENLNEISWANEKSFKQMLTAADGRHSERITAKVTETGKTLRRMKAGAMKNLKLTSTRKKQGPAKRNSAKLVQRAKYGKLKPKILVKTVPRHKVPFNKVNKITKSVTKPRKLVTKPVTKPSKIRIVKKSVAKPNNLSVLRKSVVKPNNLSVLRKSVVKPNNLSVLRKSVVKPNNLSVLRKSVVKPNNLSVLRKSVVKPNKVNVLKKSVIKRVKLNDTKPVTKSILKPNKELLKVRFKGKSLPPKSGKAKASSASSSKDIGATRDSFQNKAGNCSYTASNSSLFSAFENNMFKTENFSNFKSSSFVKELKNYEVSKEVEVVKNVNGGLDKVYETAMKKGSKLRVRVEPLQHTKLWNADFYEAFKKHVLEQAVMQTFERRDQESISTMFQELQEACFNPPNNLKPPKKKKPEEECLRSSVRQSEGAFRYKEIVVKKHENYMQFVLVPNSCKRNSLTIEAMRELRDAFLLAKKDPNCRAVLLNSSGTYFCTGIDLSLLVGSNKKQVAEDMASTIRDLVLTLSTFTKPVIAAVNGTAVGFGVSLLTYCDVVLASDKATFCIPATRLGYLPEGAITLTLPQVVGSGVATEMLLYGRRLTAEQALRHGLVSEVLWPTQLMNEVIPRIETIVSQPLQVMEATKTMVRCHLWDKLKTHIEREWRLLPPLWLDAQCQHNIKRTLQTGWLVD